MVMSKKLRKRLKLLFEQSGWKVQELARRSGVDRPTCSRILSDSPAKKDINTETLEKLAKAFGCSVEVLKEE